MATDTVAAPGVISTDKSKVYKNFIDGEWVESSTGETFENRNPADGRDLVGIFQKSGKADVDAAVEAAKRAFTKWRLVPAPRRAEIVFRAAEMLFERKEEYSRDMTREMGKVLEETRGDVQEAIDMTYFMAGEGRRQHGQTTPSELRDKFAMSVRQPLGVCAIVTPWNFPMAIPSWKIVPALVCGNTVVFKPARLTPLSALNFVRILEEAGVPPGVVNLVTGGGEEIGNVLSQHEAVRVVSFTGSTEVGRTVSEKAAPSFKKVHLEMGGKNVIMVMDDAKLDLAIEGCVWGGFGTTGQRCTAASRVIVDRSVVAPLLDRLTRRARALRLGDGLEPATEVGPLINTRARDKVEGYLDVGRRDSELVTGGTRPSDARLEHGWFLEPTIFTDVEPMDRIAQEEIFGPVLSVIPVDGYQEAVTALNQTRYGLSSSVYTSDVNAAFRAMRDFETGMVYVNAGTIGAETHLPFGGIKDTGNGHREAGHAALDTYTEWKSIYVDYSGRLQKAQIDNQPG